MFELITTYNALTVIKHEMGGAPSARNRPSFQRLQAVGAVPEGFGYSERSCSLGRQFVLHLVLVSLPHHQVTISKLPRSYSGVVLTLNSSLYRLSLHPCFLPDLIQQIQILSPFFVRVFRHEVLESWRAFLDFDWNHRIASVPSGWPRTSSCATSTVS